MAETTGDSVSDTGIGALLRASRMRIGEDLKDVALILRIRYPYLESIEDGRFEDLPGQAYAVGFIRAYADHLGLDGEEVVRRFKDEVASGAETRADLRFPTPITEASVPGGAIVFIGLLIVILAYGSWYVSTSDENYLANIIEPIPERLAALVSSDKPQDVLSLEPAITLSRPSEPEPTAMPKSPIPLQTAEVSTNSSRPTAVGKKASSLEPREPELTLDVRSSTAEPAGLALGSLPAEALAPAPIAPDTVVAAPLLDAAPTSKPPAESTAAVPAPNARAETFPSREEAAVAIDTPAASDPASPLIENSAGSGADASAMPVPETATAAVEPEAVGEAPSEPRSRVLVRAKSNSWIQVQDDFSNEIMVTRLLKAGEEYYVPDKFGLRLLTGNAGALEILVDGKPVPPIGVEGAVRRGVQLDPALLKAGNAVSE